jgi:hypothetical protein
MSKPPGSQSFYQSILNEQRFMRVIDGEGESIVPGGGGSGSEDEFTLEAAFHNPQMRLRSGKPVKFVWNVITEAKAVDIRFDFTDLPLPPE